MKRPFNILIGLLIAAGACPALAMQGPVRWTASSLVSSTPSKKDVLGKLKILQDQQIAEGTDLDNAIRKQLNETMTLNLGADDLAIAGRRTNLVTKKIDELNKRRNELNARREIVDRLIFQVDSKWDGRSKLQDFLVATFLEMASTDLSDGRDNRLWKEFTYLSMVMREVPEANDDVVSIFEGYLKSSSVLDPKSPSDFMASRNYTNGSESAQAHGGSRDSVGDKVPGAEGKGRAPIVIKTSIAADMVPQPPPASTPVPLAKSAGSTSASTHVSAAQTPGTLSGTTMRADQLAASKSSSIDKVPAQSTPAPAPNVAAQKTPIEKAQAQTGQSPMPPITGGQADSPKSLDHRFATPTPAPATTN